MPRAARMITPTQRLASGARRAVGPLSATRRAVATFGSAVVVLALGATTYVTLTRARRALADRLTGSFPNAPDRAGLTACGQPRVRASR